jgi:hypothetical protein
MLLAVTCFGQLGWGAPGLLISCEGTLCNGGGSIRYQYTLMNPGATPETLTVFYLGTDDLNPGNYTNWVAPPGFTPTALVASWGVLGGAPYNCAVMYTSHFQSPHGGGPPPPGPATLGGIYWAGSFILSPQGTATFGFDHPNDYQDVEWLAEHPGGASWTVANVNSPIAGPMGTYTDGYVHAPSSEAAAIPTLTEWGMIIFGVLLLGFITWVFLRRRRPVVSYQ